MNLLFSHIIYILGYGVMVEHAGLWSLRSEFESRQPNNCTEESFMDWRQKAWNEKRWYVAHNICHRWFKSNLYNKNIEIFKIFLS